MRGQLLAVVCVEIMQLSCDQQELQTYMNVLLLRPITYKLRDPGLGSVFKISRY